MASTSTSSPDPLAVGRFLSTSNESAVFRPLNTEYELHLIGTSTRGANTRTSLVISATGRKVLTVPAGGNFIVPIQGTPRVVQGRVWAIKGDLLTVHAGVPIQVKLPQDDSAVDLNGGAIAVGQRVNITLSPGASFSEV